MPYLDSGRKPKSKKRQELQEYLQDKRDDGVSIYKGTAVEMVGHRGVTFTISPEKKGKSKSYRVIGDNILEVT